MRVGIILGYRLNDDGTRTARLDKRCDLAIKYHKLHGLDKLIVSGGVANPYTTISEAQAMEDYLVDHTRSVFHIHLHLQHCSCSS